MELHGPVMCELGQRPRSPVNLPIIGHHARNDVHNVHAIHKFFLVSELSPTTPACSMSPPPRFLEAFLTQVTARDTAPNGLNLIVSCQDVNPAAHFESEHQSPTARIAASPKLKTILRNFRFREVPVLQVRREPYGNTHLGFLGNLIHVDSLDGRAI